MNADHDDYAPPGACEQYEFDLVEWVDGTLPPMPRAALERHLEACARCRAFVREFRGIAASLAQALPRAELSSDFDSRLYARIATLGRVADKDTARTLAEQEYRFAVAGLKRGLTWRTLLNACATASACAGVAIVTRTLAPEVLQATGFAPVVDVTGLAVGVLALLAGGWVAHVSRRVPGALFS